MFEYQDRIRDVLDSIPGSREAGMFIFASSAIEITLYGDDLDLLYDKAEEMRIAMSKIEGAEDARTSMQGLLSTE